MRRGIGLFLGLLPFRGMSLFFLLTGYRMIKPGRDIAREMALHFTLLWLEDVVVVGLRNESVNRPAAHIRVTPVAVVRVRPIPRGQEPYYEHQNAPTSCEHAQGRNEDGDGCRTLILCLRGLTQVIHGEDRGLRRIGRRRRIALTECVPQTRLKLRTKQSPNDLRIRGIPSRCYNVPVVGRSAIALKAKGVGEELGGCLRYGCVDHGRVEDEVVLGPGVADVDADSGQQRLNEVYEGTGDDVAAEIIEGDRRPVG